MESEIDKPMKNIGFKGMSAFFALRDKFSDPMKKITKARVKNGDYVDLSIQDTGIGITMEEKYQLFKEFGKIVRYGDSLGIDNEGTGLGLYISKAIVEMHGGKIELESKGRNKGSTFTVKLLKTP